MVSQGRRFDLGSLISILVMGTTLRAAIVAFGPVAQRIGDDLSISGASLGLLASLPVVMFGLVSAFVARPARAIGFDRLSLIALLTLGLGMATRLIPEAWAMWAGTAAVGLGIGVLNVLVPAFVKRDFPLKMSFVTGLYSAVVAAAAAAGIGLAIPLTLAFAGDWRIALASSLPLVVLSIMLQVRRVVARERAANDTGSRPARQALPHPPTEPASLWKSPLAWAVTAYMGLQSFTFYSFVSWMPAITVDAGFTENEAGLHLAINQIVGIPAAIIVAVLMQRFRDQRAVASGVAVLGMVPFVGTLFLPELLPLWTPLFGFVSSSYFLIALALIGERASTSRDAARLSGMAQSIGYLVAALGPVAAGWLHDSTDSWQPVLWMFIVVAGLIACAGLVAGQRKQV